MANERWMMPGAQFSSRQSLANHSMYKKVKNNSEYNVGRVCKFIFRNMCMDPPRNHTLCKSV
jgi:hypothetical protein